MPGLKGALLAILLLSVGIVESASAGAWVQGKGEF